MNNCRITLWVDIWIKGLTTNLCITFLGNISAISLIFHPCKEIHAHLMNLRIHLIEYKNV